MRIKVSFASAGFKAGNTIKQSVKQVKCFNKSNISRSFNEICTLKNDSQIYALQTLFSHSTLLRPDQLPFQQKNSNCSK